MTWNVDAARIIDSLESPKFSSDLSKALKGIVDFEYMVIFGYVGTSRPLALFDDFPAGRKQMHVDEYLKGPYLLDPFFLASTGTVEPGLWRLREIAPDRFYQGEYFRSYYAQTGLAEEVGFLIDIHDKLSIVISLMRKTKKFTKIEMRALRDVWPIVEAACKRQWRDTARNSQDDMPVMQEKVAHAFLSIGKGVLTPREREVVEYTLRGHSADAVGKLLGISSGTVRIHRKNIYSKLRINAQGELFSAFIAAIIESPEQGPSLSG